MFRNTRVQACHLSLASTIGLYSTITSLWNANAPTQCPQMLSSFLFPLTFLWLVTKLGLIYSKPIAHKVRGDLVISKLLKTFIYILFPGQKAFIKKAWILNWHETVLVSVTRYMLVQVNLLIYEVRSLLIPVHQF